MARVAFAERPSSLKVLGALFIAVMIFFLWLTAAFFNKSFTDYDKVTLIGAKAGLNLPESADIKLRGMIVGEVRGIEADKGEIIITLGMNPDYINDVPAEVTAEIVPKTLFGEKYISLIPPKDASGESLKAGDTIKGAEVPIEVEKLLNDLYPLLDAVDPVNLNYTLSAMATALEGRGEDLGNTLVTFNSYLKKINPETPQLVDDFIKFGTVSDAYADAMPQLGRFLRNSVISGNTVVAKRKQFASFFDESTRLANTLTKFTKKNGDNIEALARLNVEPLRISAKYSITYPCFFQGLEKVLPLADSALRNRTIHIDLETLPEQPTAYEPSGQTNDPDADPYGERAVLPKQSKINNTPAADPTNKSRSDSGGPGGLGAACEDLKKYASGSGPYGNGPYTQNTTPLPTFPESVYRLTNITSDHNGKFGNWRAPAASLTTVDTDEQRLGLRRLAAVVAGVPVEDIPDVASLMLSPIVRGSEASIR